MIKFYFPTEYIPLDELNVIKESKGELTPYYEINIPDKCGTCNNDFIVQNVGDQYSETELEDYCIHIRVYASIWNIRIKNVANINHANDGYKCDSCNEWVPMACSNRPNNKFRCYSCRNHPLLVLTP